MNINKKSAFTIAELVLTTVIMSVVCIIAPMAILKRDVKPPKKKKLEYIAKCTTKCLYDAHTGELVSIDSNDRASLDYNKNSNEFYTIELVGGGGGGTRNSIGYPGESKAIYLPSLDENSGISDSTDDNKYRGILTGYYLLETGSGGRSATTTAASGTDTKICVIGHDVATRIKNSPSNIEPISCVGRTVIALAKGGITSGEKHEEQLEVNETEDRFPSIRHERESNTDNKTYYGQGGRKGSNAGVGGVIVIK